VDSLAGLSFAASPGNRGREDQKLLSFNQDDGVTFVSGNVLAALTQGRVELVFWLYDFNDLHLNSIYNIS
jgi:hypothetical protein